MRILVDTNVLCRIAQVGHESHAAAERSVTSLKARRETLCLVPQVIYEYWVVATRPVADNGLGMEPKAAAKALDLWNKLFTMLLDERGIYSTWREIVQEHGVRGKAGHDAHLVAAMTRHGVSHVLTFNRSDFTRFPNIHVIDPESVGPHAERQ